ncbi:MAG: hypothetical protein WCO04_19980, partial [Pseudomonadota bacterium]
MDARAIIAQIRDGATPPADQIAWFAAGLASGTVSDAQAGAFAAMIAAGDTAIAEILVIA